MHSLAAARQRLHAVFLALLFSVATLAHADEIALPTFITNDEVGFTISYPPTWNVQFYPDANQVDFGMGSAFFMVDAIEIDMLPSADLADVFDLLMEDLEFFLDDFDATPLPEHMYAERETLAVRYSGVEFGVEVIGTLFLFMTETYAFILNYEADADEYDELEATFEAMLASFTLGD